MIAQVLRFLAMLPIALGTLCAFVLASGCATSGFSSSENPVESLGQGASFSIVVPVRGNEALLERMAERAGKVRGAKDAIARTDIVYAGLFETADNRREFRFIATGSFPKAFSRLFLTKSRGWTRMRRDGFSWYRSSTLDVAIQAGGTVCGTSSRTDDILALIARVREGAGEASGMPRSFSEYASHAREDGRIGFFTDKAGALIERVLGPDVSLPVRFAECYAVKSGEESYAVSARLTLADVRSARAMKILLAIALDGADIVIEGDTVIISGYRVATEKLAASADFLYF